VLDLRSFTYDSKTSRIMQERVKNMSVMEGDPISVITQVPVMRDVREDPMETTIAGSAFMDANIDNI
jgi:hypothetical protein